MFEREIKDGSSAAFPGKNEDGRDLGLPVERKKGSEQAKGRRLLSYSWGVEEQVSDDARRRPSMTQAGLDQWLLSTQTGQEKGNGDTNALYIYTHVAYTRRKTSTE